MDQQWNELGLVLKGLFENIQKEKKEREAQEEEMRKKLKKEDEKDDPAFKWDDAAKEITVDVYGHQAVAKPRMVVLSNNDQRELAYEYAFVVQDANMKLEVARLYLTYEGELRDGNGDKVATHQDLYLEEFIELFVLTQALDSMLFAVSPNQSANKALKCRDGEEEAKNKF